MNPSHPTRPTISSSHRRPKGDSAHRSIEVRLIQFSPNEIRIFLPQDSLPLTLRFLARRHWLQLFKKPLPGSPPLFRLQPHSRARLLIDPANHTVFVQTARQEYLTALGEDHRLTIEC